MIILESVNNNYSTPESMKNDYNTGKCEELLYYYTEIESVEKDYNN